MAKCSNGREAPAAHAHCTCLRGEKPPIGEGSKCILSLPTLCLTSALTNIFSFFYTLCFLIAFVRPRGDLLKTSWLGIAPWERAFQFFKLAALSLFHFSAQHILIGIEPFHTSWSLSSCNPLPWGLTNQVFWHQSFSLNPQRSAVSLPEYVKGGEDLPLPRAS